MVDLCANLEVKRPTAQNFIALLEAKHLIYRLPPFGYGKDIGQGYAMHTLQPKPSRTIP